MMKNIIISAVISVFARAVSGAAIPRAIEERQIQPISTVTGPIGTSYIYALASPIPESIAAQLATIVSAVPTSTPTSVQSDSSIPSATAVERTAPVASAPASGTYRNVGYYGTWFMYDRQFKPSDVIVSQWTHLIVGFWDIGADGTISPIDPWSDLQVKTLGDASSQAGAVNGVFEQVFRLKNQNRNLKVMLSIGGWEATYKGAWANKLATPELRLAFAKSAAQTVVDLGLDGIDFDWEYPQNEAETIMHTDSMRLLRQELDAVQKVIGAERLLLSMAAPVGPHYIKGVNIVELNNYLDFFNLMGYDMSGSAFSKVSSHAAPFFMATDGSTEFCLVDGLEMYLAAGVPADKINVLGPIYGHSFAGTDGPGKPFTGPGFSSWGEQNGVPDYNLIPTDGDNVVFEDEKIMASWTYNSQTREMVSFDTPRIVEIKTQYIMSRGIGGIGFWAINADKWTYAGNLVNIALTTLGGPSVLERVDNHLTYTGSKYPNIRAYDGVIPAQGKTIAS
ncbi:hypothetical protein TWF481_004070 [Arthrobotrys musiformis]|uniref:chitinase n=1 Tax=Arthrobotrys musiformis TaxID=47236 RepID=A0AAV9WIE1_9PEZI